MDYLQWDAEVAVRMPFTAGLDFDIERVIYEGKDCVTCELVPEVGTPRHFCLLFKHCFVCRLSDSTVSEDAGLNRLLQSF
jgi:hypothetical protein